MTRLRTLVVLSAPGAGRILDVSVANLGNVTERLPRGRLLVTLMRGGRGKAVVPAVARELVPGTRGIVSAHYAGCLRCRLTALVELQGCTPTRRAFRVRF